MPRVKPDPIRVRDEQGYQHTLNKEGGMWRCGCCTLTMTEREVCEMLIHGEGIATVEEEPEETCSQCGATVEGYHACQMYYDEPDDTNDDDRIGP